MTKDYKEYVALERNYSLKPRFITMGFEGVHTTKKISQISLDCTLSYFQNQQAAQSNLFNIQIGNSYAKQTTRLPQ